MTRGLLSYYYKSLAHWLCVCVTPVRSGAYLYEWAAPPPAPRLLSDIEIAAEGGDTSPWTKASDSLAGVGRSNSAPAAHSGHMTLTLSVPADGVCYVGRRVLAPDPT